MDLKTVINLKQEKVIENNVDMTLEEILDMFAKQVIHQLNNCHIYDTEPELSYDDYTDSVTVNLSLGGVQDPEAIIDDAKIMFEEAIEKHFADKIAAASLPQKNEEPKESGEVVL
tara:strand:- start:110 stop:454 length:345 start_codon:yes stop_codon:yes gene_type:complete